MAAQALLESVAVASARVQQGEVQMFLAHLLHAPGGGSLSGIQRGIAMLPKAGHMMQMERPREVNEWILKFLATVR